MKGSLGTYCGQRGQTDTEIRTTWCWNGRATEKKKENETAKKEKRNGNCISVQFLTCCVFMTHNSLSHIPVRFTVFPPQREWLHERIVRSDCRGPERGAGWVNMWNSCANRYANCISERMLAHCELFHSKQWWAKLWIMTTSASARICKHWAPDRKCKWAV